MANIIEKTGKSYNIFDKVNNVWNKISFWHKASDCEFNDGKTAQTKLGAINGITSDLSGESETVAASIKCVNQLNSSLGGFTPVIDSTGKITGYKTKAGADTVFPFKGEITSGEAWCKSMEHYRATYSGSLTHFDMDFTNIKSFTIALVNPQSYAAGYRHYIKLYDSNNTEIKDNTITTTPVTFSDTNILTKAKKICLYYPSATDYSFSYETK